MNISLQPKTQTPKALLELVSDMQSNSDAEVFVTVQRTCSPKPNKSKAKTAVPNPLLMAALTI